MAQTLIFVLKVILILCAAIFISALPSNIYSLVFSMCLLFLVGVVVLPYRRWAIPMFILGILIGMSSIPRIYIYSMDEIDLFLIGMIWGGIIGLGVGITIDFCMKKKSPKSH